ncbi:MAG: glycosyltransferase family 29 protein, partial [Bacteroidota bacterium]
VHGFAPLTQPYADNLRFPKNIAVFKGRFFLTDPEFVRYVQEEWFRVFAPKGDGQKVPSIGFFTLVMAFHLCDSVSIFGFSPPDAKGRWGHYFEQVTRRVPFRHHADQQWDLIVEMHERGIITLHSKALREKSY